MAEADRPQPLKPLECREPTLEDLVRLCRSLNTAGARYVVVGGFAIRAAGFTRNTMDVDLLVEIGPENEARVIQGLLCLPDQAAGTAVIRQIDGVPIPFASPPTLWRMKQTVRERDVPDRLFLRQWHAAHGIALDPPPPGAAPPTGNAPARTWRRLRDWWRSR